MRGQRVWKAAVSKARRNALGLAFVLPAALLSGTSIAAAGPALLDPWAGSFFGVQGVGEFSNVTALGSLASGANDRLTATGSGFGGGVNTGYSYHPAGSALVFGYVGRYDFLNDRAASSFGRDGLGQQVSTINFETDTLARVGYLVSPDTLLYGLAGLSIANQNISINSTGGTVFKTSQYTTGFTIGAGGEYRTTFTFLPILGPTSLFADYTHTIWSEVAATQTLSPTRSNGYGWERGSDRVTFGARWNVSPIVDSILPSR